MSNEKQLNDLIVRYTEVKQEARSLANREQVAKKAKVSLKKPQVFETLDGAVLFAAQSRMADEEYQGAGQALRAAREEIKSLEQKIFSLIPVQNSWVKVGEFGVGFYWDVWGGGHRVIKVSRWSDDHSVMGSLEDRLHYS